MPFRPLRRKCWEKYLKLKGFSLERITASHYQWVKKGALRPIPVWGDEKDVPPWHLKTGCDTLGIKMSALYKWADINC